MKNKLYTDKEIKQIFETVYKFDEEIAMQIAEKYSLFGDVVNGWDCLYTEAEVEGKATEIANTLDEDLDQEFFCDSHGTLYSINEILDKD